MSEIKVKFRHTANLFENAVQRKKPTGSSFPIAKNLSKLEGDQVGHIVFEPDSRCPLRCCITDQDECRSQGSEPWKQKSPHRLAPLNGTACMGFYEVCFTHTYYNKVGTRIIEGHKKKARQRTV